MLFFSGDRIENVSLKNLIEMRCSEGFRAVELVVKQPQLSSSSSAGGGGGGGAGTAGVAAGAFAGGVIGEGDLKRAKRGSAAATATAAGRRVRKPSISYGNVEKLYLLARHLSGIFSSAEIVE